MTRKAVIGLMRSAALAAALFLAGGALPFVGLALALFVPMTVMGYAVGRPAPIKRTAAALGLAGVLVGLVAGPQAALAFLGIFGVGTAVICLMLERQQPFELIVLLASAAMLAAGGAGLLAMAGSPQLLANLVHDTLAAGLTRSEHFYQTLGFGKGMEPATQERLLELTVRLCPALAALMAAFTVMINLVFFWRSVGKLRLGYPLFGDLARWHTPEWLIWLFLLTGFGLFIPVAPLRTFALDSFICTAAVYFCQGLAIVAFYFRMLAMPAAVRGLVYCLAALQPVLAALLCVLGIFDMWVDFRRLKPPSHEAGSFGDFF